MIPWHAIDTVLLDMDGTLLDLHFDNHFWREHVPLRYAERHGLGLEEARRVLFPRFRAMEGKIEWYCLDYWSEALDIDIPALKREVAHLIALHPHVIPFLEQVRGAGKRAVLVTNAHPKSLALKLERTALGGHLDAIVCAHDLGLPKEEAGFWERLEGIEPFDAVRTLFIDDSLPVLRSARGYGIRYLVTLGQPDSQAPPRKEGEFRQIHDFGELLPVKPSIGRLPVRR